MRNLNSLDTLLFTLLIVGGLNWGTVGLLDLNMVAAIFGEDSILSDLIYILVGLSALYAAYKIFIEKPAERKRAIPG